MLHFIGGPADGRSINVKRAPIFLRVVRNRSTGEFDALDQLHDSANPNEEIFAYYAIRYGNRYHLRCGGKSRANSGWYQDATYQIVEDQPSDDVLRDDVRWREWAMAQDKPAELGDVKTEKDDAP